ncbi:MAG: hypothetical protein O7E51_13555 [Acidobacteria bacterium]|nr:hypothetical protein [Acidobacteriota bacterium]
MKRTALSICIVLLLVAACSSGPQKLENPREIVQQAIDALGGLEGWNALQDVTFREIRIRYENGEPGAERRRINYFKRDHQGGDKIRIEEENPNGTRLMVFDGQEAWGQISDRVFSGPGATLGGRGTGARAGMPLRWQSQATLYFFSLPFKLLDPGVNLTLEGEESVEGNLCYVVKVTFGEEVGDHSDHSYTFFIDQQSFRIHKYSFTQWSVEPYTRDVHLPDWQQVGPVVKHMRQVQYLDGKLHAERRWEILSVNQGLDDSLFTLPAGSDGGSPNP